MSRVANLGQEMVEGSLDHRFMLSASIRVHLRPIQQGGAMVEPLSAVLEDGLKDKVAIVTGAGAADDGIGNGRAAAILLAQAGAQVLVVDMDKARAERTVQMIRDIGGSAVAHGADVTDEAAC